MDNWLPFVILAALIAMGVLAVSYYAEKQRREQLQVIASRMNLSFSPDADPYLLETLRHFHLFSQGHSRKVRNVMKGRVDDVAVTLFDYKYSASRGKHNDTRRQTVLLLESERLQLPFFTLRPEHFLHRMAGAFGYEDIDFDSNPAFSDAYLLKGEDETQIRTTFTREILDFYTHHAQRCTEGAGHQLLLYRAGTRISPEQIEGFLHEGVEILGLFVEREEIDWEQLLAPLDLPA